MGKDAVTGGQIGLREHLLTQQVLICRFSRAESIRIMQLRWACSSAGRAPALQAGGRRFDPGHVHQLSARKSITSLIWPLSNFGKFGNTREQLIFKLIDRLSLGARTGVRVYLKCGRHARVPELSLGHL
jgi:hypothetical protein